MNTPILKLKFEHMEQELSVAIAGHLLQMDQMAQAALKAACSEENVRRVLTETTEAVLKKVLADEVNAFFSYGEGRKSLRVCVKEKLNKLFHEAEPEPDPNDATDEEFNGFVNDIIDYIGATAGPSTVLVKSSVDPTRLYRLMLLVQTTHGPRAVAVDSDEMLDLTSLVDNLVTNMGEDWDKKIINYTVMRKREVR